MNLIEYAIDSSPIQIKYGQCLPYKQIQWSVLIKFWQSDRNKKRLQLCAWSFVIAIGLLLIAQVVQAQVKLVAANSQGGADASIVLNFVAADIESVSSALARLTGQTILVDPKVRGSINLVSSSPVNKAKALDSFSTALRSSGFALVNTNGIYRVVSELDAKLISNRVLTGSVGQDGDQMLTRIFKLNYESASNLIQVLKPLVSTNSVINAYPGNNTIVVTDYASNLQRISKLVESIDVQTSTEVQNIKLNFAIAMDIAAIINKVMDGVATGAGTTDQSLKTIVIAEPRSNSILIRGASVERIRHIRQLVARLDVPSTNNGNIWVVPLKNAEATKLAITLRAIVAADTGLALQTTGTGQPIAGVNAAAANALLSTQAASAVGIGGASAATSALTSSSNPSTGGIIQAEPATNSIIITAAEPLYRNLRYVIEQLDRRRAQVYIESLIVEVSSTNAAELGIQWQGLIGSGNQNTGFGGTNYTNAGGIPGSNIVNLSQNINGILNPSAQSSTPIPPAPGLNLGLLTKFNGVYGMSALITALATTQGTNILSTPNLITLDNEEARIVVGQNVPIVTGQYAQTGSTSTVSPFQTIARQDVGLTLRVRPQISDNGLVKMQIYQEVSSIYNQNFASGIILNKRNIESNVLVDDGQIIVLGGLIEDSYSDGSSGVPFLSTIPIIGALFRSDSKSRTKTNLLVFIRPYILRDKEQNAELSKNRLGLIQNSEEQFKQAPMLLPKEVLPNVSTFEPPLIAPKKQKEGINMDFGIAPGSRRTEGGMEPANAPIPIPVPVEDRP